jgi:hypothetical protein
LDGRGEGVSMWSDKVAGMVWVLVMVTKREGCSGLYWCPGVW